MAGAERTMHDLLTSQRVIEPAHDVATQAEADHRIANSLSLVASFMRLQARDLRQRSMLTGADAADLLDESVSRVESVAHLHRLLSANDGKSDDCSTYLRGVGEAAGRVCAYSGEASLHFDLVRGLYLDPTRLAALGLLLNEAVINAHKYAHPTGVDGRIAVSCRPCEGGWSMVIEDDGVGLPEDLDTENGGGLGFKVMRALAHKLGAQLRHVSGPLGHRVEVVLSP
jgi:two-component sensor histidine kinase